MERRLLDAASNGNVETVINTLDYIEDVNLVMDQKGNNPLHLASKNGNHEHYTAIVNLLIEKGADINATNNFGSTPLHWASKEGHSEVVNLLINKRANIHIVDSSGNTPLHLASLVGHAEVVNLLIEKGADIDAKNNSNYTPDRLAIMNGRYNVIKNMFPNAEAVVRPRTPEKSKQLPVAKKVHRPVVAQPVEGGKKTTRKKRIRKPKTAKKQIKNQRNKKQESKKSRKRNK